MKFNYREEAATNEWQRKSGHIKERDNYTCQLCGSKDKFVHVHHCYYEEGRHYWDYPDESLITLCEDCHGKEHSLTSNAALDLINEAVFKARHAGVMCLEIINSINKLAEKYNAYRPNDTIYKSKINTSVKKQIYNYKPLNINERKRVFLEELAQYGLKYEADYIQSFANYWTEIVFKKLRFENNSNFLMPTYLSNWEEERIDIEKEQEFRKLLGEATIYAKEQLEGYKSVIDPIIASEIEEIEQNELPIKTKLLEMFYSKAEEMKSTKMQEVISSYKNPKTTVYDYLRKVSRPGTFVEVYKIDPLTNSNYTLHDNTYMRDLNITKSYIWPKKSMNPQSENINAIEKYFNIDLWLPIPFKKHIDYIMDSNFYIKRQEYKYMLNFPKYTKRFLKEKYISTDLITINDFTMLYEARQAFLRNNEWNLKRLDYLGDIPLIEFCKLVNIESKDINPETTLKTFIESKSNLCSVQIEFPQSIGAQFFLEISFGFSNWNETLATILEKMNELYGFTFVVYLNQTQRTVHVPLEILALTNGYMFDFCTESFNNGTMTSIQLPKELQSIDYYCDRIKMLIDYKKGRK